jgi:cytochrome c553
MNKILLIAGLLVTGLSFAGGNPVEGKKKVEQVCQSCHGLDGLGINDTYPKLAGQFADYLVKALSDYKTGERKNPIMSGFASSLSEQDIENVAVYYSRLTVDKLHDLTIK